MPGITNLGPWPVSSGGFQVRNGVRYFSGSGFPKSGTAGTGIDRDGNGAPTGSIYTDSATGVSFVNEGSDSSPYWSPTSFTQHRLMGFFDDFRNGLGKAVADTATSAVLSASGIRVSGQGIDETDSGFVVASTEDGAVGTLTTTDEVDHTAVLSPGPLANTSALFQPDQSGPLVVDCNVSNSSAITLRRMFLGFSGTATLALDPLITGATVTLTFANTISDDIAGLFFDVGLTAGSTWMAASDKGNANATQLVTATGVNTGITVAAAGTYQRLRTEVWADGAVKMFINKTQVASFAAGTLDTDEEIHPVLQLGSTSTAVKSALIKHFACWGKRP